MAHPVLEPLSVPLGPRPADQVLYVPNQVTLQMKEKIMSLSGDSFTIKTADGADVLMCKGKTFSVHGKKTFTDMSGRELYVLENKLFKLHKSFHAVSSEGFDFEVKGKFSFGKSRSVVEFKNAADGAAIELEVEGSWFDRKADIKLNGRPVAHISRDFFNAREIFGGQQTYFVTVAANVDLSLIAGICVCLDERQNEGS